MEIYAVKLDRSLDLGKYEILANIVSDDKRKRLARFHYFEDTQRTLVADVIVRFLICRSINTKMDSIVFEYNEYGKPLVKDFPEIHFNISHSGIWVVAAVSNLPVGIDVERIKEIDFNIAKRFFSDSEYEKLISIPEIDRLEYFYELWTLKESYVKALGRGLAMSLDSFAIEVTDSKRISIDTCNSLPKFFFKQYEIDKAYKMAVCSQEDEFPGIIKVLDTESFYSEIQSSI